MLPLQLTLRGKSTTQSYRTPIYYVDLTLRDGINLQEAISSAKQMDEQSKAAGFIRRRWIMWHGRVMAMPALGWVERS
jgi:hypothetical protein